MLEPENHLRLVTDAIPQLARCTSLLDLSGDAILVRDMNDVIAYWSAGAEQMYGWKREDALGKVVYQLLQTVYPVELESLKLQVIRECRWDGELIQTRRDGKQIVVSSRWVLQRDAAGKPVAILQINTDITERKRAEQALQEAQAELVHVARFTTIGKLAASIAHQVRQPLAAVVTNANACRRWLAGEPPNIDEALQAVTGIIRESQRASEVVQSIRSLVKKTSPQMVRLDVNELIREILALTQNEVQRNCVSLRTELDADLPAVRGDRVQLQQVILNLLMNGIEAISAAAGGPRDLAVATRRLELGQVLVMVRDSGIGIDRQSLDRLFNPFFTTKPDGLGIGLSISRSIIEAHRGRLWATANEGRGASFQFTLPGATEIPDG